MRFPDLRRCPGFSLDTETTGVTFGDRPVGISVATPDHEAWYLRWGHEGGGNNCTLTEARNWANEQLANPRQRVAMHNAGFDLRMLAYEGIRVRSRVEDTGVIAPLLNELERSFSLDALSQKYAGIAKSDDGLNRWCAEHFGGMATRKGQAGNYWRAPGDVVEEYAKGDAIMTEALYQALRPKIDEEDLGDIYETETALIPILLRMHMTGVRVNVDAAQRLKAKLKAQYAILEKRWNSETGHVNYRSTPQLAKLFRELGLPVWTTKPNKQGKGGGRDSITKDLLVTLEHPVPQMIVKLRQLSHYSGTFIDSYLLSNAGEDGFIHGEFHQVKKDDYGTVSGRFSSGGALNLQNIPARDEEWAPLIRGLFIPATEDHDWWKYDYSQIEYRFLAHYAGGQLLDAYLNDPDVDFHEACSRLTGVPRKPAKNLNFGFVYGMGEELLAIKLGKPLEEAQEIFAQYHGRLPEVKALYNKASARAKKKGVITTWGGRKRRFPANPNFQKLVQGRNGSYRDRNAFAFTHKALNALLQGSAADLMKKAMVEVDKIINWEDELLHLTVHDELDLSLPRGQLATARRIKEAMQDYRLRVPIAADAERGRDWGHVEELTPEQWAA